jgi:predicted nuclease of predicted toxin-antitoxin system
MRIYVDDDTAAGVFVQLLVKAGHDVVIPRDADLLGADDPAHLTHAIREGRVMLSGNHHDFEALHDLIMQARGHHPGILVIRRDNDPRRDMTPRGIVHTIRNLTGAGVPLADCFYVLNHWR